MYANKALVSKLGCKSRDPSLINISRGTRDRIKRGAKRTGAPSFRRGHPRELPVSPFLSRTPTTVLGVVPIINGPSVGMMVMKPWIFVEHRRDRLAKARPSSPDACPYDIYRIFALDVIFLLHDID